jgi:hypothetical protein
MRLKNKIAALKAQSTREKNDRESEKIEKEPK